MKSNTIKLSAVSSLHYFKLFYRSVLLIVAALFYVTDRIGSRNGLYQGLQKHRWLLLIIWIIYAVEMILRFFPSELESMGSQKQFSRNYQPSGRTELNLTSPWRTFAATAAWLALNGLFGLLFFRKIIDRDILVLISLAYGVCDMVCILFFCPFQTFILKNRCCTDCRIYNWDYAMMFTPLFFVRRSYAWSLLALSVALLIRWEITFFRHPERFSENTNAYLHCKNCTEKLCAHKKQLTSLWKQIEEYAAERIKRLKGVGGGGSQ